MRRLARCPLAALALIAGCTAIPEEEAALLTGEIDCARADDTVAALRRARPGEARKARVLASSLTPGGLALGVATDDIADRERLLSGEYAAQIDARIAELRQSCNLTDPVTSAS